MKNAFSSLVLVMLGVLSLSMGGCTREEEKPDPVKFILANPPNGSQIQPDATVSVVFDSVPVNVAVTAGTAKTVGQTVTVSGPFAVGPLNLIITWSGDARVLNYTVARPVAFANAFPPNGSVIQRDDTISVVFDSVPANVAVTSGTAKTVGQTVTVSGPFAVGPLNLTISWRGGASVLNYTVARPVAFANAFPPNGSVIQRDDTISVVFDSVPANVAVTAGTAKTEGQTVTISGPFTVGPLDLTISWRGGARMLNYTVNDPVPEGMALIPAGEFQMGSVDGDDDEQPVHTVYVDAFFMDEHEVTNLEYKRFVLANPRWSKDRIDRIFQNGNYLKHWNGNNYPNGKGNHPVVYVSWYAAMAYAGWVEKRLPTEAEWEASGAGRIGGQKVSVGECH